jgi:predicted HTH transcriptional regulator
MYDRQRKILANLISQSQESEWLEFKVNNADPERIGQRLSALANGASLREKPHGYLVFGISDDREVVGTTFQPLSQKKGNEELESWLLRRLSPGIDVQVFEFDFRGKQVTMFEIPAASGQPVRFSHEAYIRIGSTTRKLTRYPEKERLIWRQMGKQTFGDSISLQELSQDDVLVLIDFETCFKLLGIRLVYNPAYIIQKLQEEEIITRATHGYGITNLGAILFSKDLMQFDRLKRKAIRVIRYQGYSRITTKWEQLGQKGYAVGFEGLIRFINDRLPQNEEIGQALREKVSLYPELAVRELVANSIIHQDFSLYGTGPTIEIFDDRIEVTNPGHPIIDPLRFIDHAPRSRNEKIASCMRRMNICEERGSGIDKVVFNCEYYQLPAPDFIAEEAFTKVVLFAPQALSNMQKSDKIRSCYQHCCLKYVSNDPMTNSSLRERFKVDKHNYSVVSRIIADTIEAGLIRNDESSGNSKKYAKYLPFWV